MAGIDPNLPIILLTGHQQKGAIQNAYKAGVDLFLEKPFSVRSLIAGIARVTTSEPETHDAPMIVVHQPI